MTTQINTLQYNELSQLKAKYLNGTATSHVQRQLYYYNVRGWLTRINDPSIYCDDVLAEKLYYNNVPSYATSLARGCYNGNINTMEWFTKNMVAEGYMNGYGYKYDGLNRLKSGNFFSRLNTSGASQEEPSGASNQDYGTITSIGSENNITYDKNGNILTLNRYGSRTDGVVLFDQLSFQYAGNQLTKVIDAITGLNSLGDFRNTTSPTAKNEYDANGNLVFDVDRNMQLGYNSDNLPVTILHDNGLISNTYRADGMKTGKMVYDGKGRLTLNETYLGNLVLNFGVPSRILHSEGVVDLANISQPVYYYHLKDHLGNVRAVVTPTTANAATISQTSEYYPFGMCYTKNPASYINKDKFGGKEEQEMPGKYLDFGARFYDPQLPHFITMDAMAELHYDYTPYSYCYNNPSRFADLLGNDTTETVGADGLTNSQWVKKGEKGRSGDGITLSFPSYQSPEEQMQDFKQGISDGVSEGLIGENLVSTDNVVIFDEENHTIYVISKDVLRGMSPYYSSGKELGHMFGNAMLVLSFLDAAMAEGSIIANTQKVYRVFGDDALKDGFSWTPVNPNNVSDFRNFAGLPSGGASGANNTGRFVVEGVVNPKYIINSRSALPLDGNAGGMMEYIINPKNIKVIRISGANPKL